ncbi:MULTISPECIES: DUF2975 domain-containing protein [unclassified Agrococcus]|uniref:DUF2975 domain-containing protein n=1 Tax=unclassified Agrococcus TaxID=2615065 RepID=UPI00361EAF9F
MSSPVIAALRVVLVVIGLGAVVLQLVLVPELAREAADGDARLVPAIAPYAVAGIALVVCVQVVLVCTWMLLRRVQHGAIFERSALRWVDGIVAAAALATTIVLALTVHLLAVVGTGGPGVLLVLLCLLVGGVAATLLMLVMRGLLVGASGLRSELAEVV